MQCPECQSAHIRKNGKKKGKQNHICVDCGRLFIDCYDPPQGYSDLLHPVQSPEVGELDELETFVGAKKTKSGSGQR
jgi:hypothetical protein